MNNKIFIFRSLLFAVAVCILLFDMILWLTGQGKQLEHRNALLTCLLLWFASLFHPQNSDDDWAGEI